MHCFNSNAIFLVIFDNMFENIDKQNTMDISCEWISDFIFNYNLIKLAVNKKLRHWFFAVFPKRKSVYQPYLFHNSQASTNATHHCPQGPRGAQQSFILKGPTQTSNREPLIYHFWRKRYSFSYTFYWQILSPSHTQFRTFQPLWLLLMHSL